MMLQHDFAVVGGGPVGLTTALALDAAGHSVALVAPKVQMFDVGRTAALMAPALEFLAGLVPLAALEEIGATLDGIRIIDITGAMFRAPTVTFRASEIGLDRFGLNLPNDKLVEVLSDAVSAKPGIHWFDAKLEQLDQQPEGLILHLSDATEIAAHAAIGADGKRSVLRELSGIPSREWSYDQVALTFHVGHERDHMDISTEFHTREGPFTLVPLADRVSSVVWMMRPEKARQRLELTPDAFQREAQAMAQSMLGKFTLLTERARIPMTGLSASSLAKHRIALVGEAAHAFPPIGAQGLNLGIRDVKDLMGVLNSRSPIEDAFRRYAAKRQADVLLRTTAVDAMNRSLLAGFMPLDALRGLGMSAIEAFSPLRRAVMRAGIGDMSGMLPKPFQGKRSAGR